MPYLPYFLDCQTLMSPSNNLIFIFIFPVFPVPKPQHPSLNIQFTSSIALHSENKIEVDANWREKVSPHCGTVAQ